MPRGFRLDWKGDQIKKRLLNAARQGIDETMADCVVEAMKNTPVDTTTLQGSEEFEKAVIRGDVVSGRWGSYDVEYAFYVEVGARGRPGENMLRDAADKEYPKLKKRIAERFKRSI